MSALSELRDYVALAEERFKQYRDLLTRRELVKAGEVLWSAVMALLEALSLVLRGEPVRSHREAKDFVKRWLAPLYASACGGDPKLLLELFARAERLHANFYHEMLDEEELLRDLGAAEELARELRGILDLLMRLRGPRAPEDRGRPP